MFFLTLRELHPVVRACVCVRIYTHIRLFVYTKTFESIYVGDKKREKWQILKVSAQKSVFSKFSARVYNLPKDIEIVKPKKGIENEKNERKNGNEDEEAQMRREKQTKQQIKRNDNDDNEERKEIKIHKLISLKLL